jgi:two-component system cell cycle response regulator
VHATIAQKRSCALKFPYAASVTPLVNGAQPRVILVDVNDESRNVMTRRLTAQGYRVDATADPSAGADLALSSPPDLLIADLWMPSISGVQLCRLLRAEPATAEVPVVLRGQHDDPRSRFWAERAGAAAYVVKGRMAELVRVLARASASKRDSGFFMQLSGGSVDIRDRIARHLDAALFDSVIASEVRALASCASFERLFDLFSQFLSQVISYRWLAISTTTPDQFALHHHPHGSTAEDEARAALGIGPDLPVLRVADEDARDEQGASDPILCDIPFGTVLLGRLALGPSTKSEPDTATLVSLVAREVAGPLRITALMHELQELATTDPLTKLMNRRAFLEMMVVELERSRRYEMSLSILLLDVDHFKAVNDGHGHAAGDKVLAAMGELLRKQLRIPDAPARWGGEEFVLALKNTGRAGAVVVAERILNGIRALEIQLPETTLRITASIGVATAVPGESADAVIDRADQAMYAAKLGGRNRLRVSEEETAPSAANKALYVQ